MAGGVDRLLAPVGPDLADQDLDLACQISSPPPGFHNGESRKHLGGRQVGNSPLPPIPPPPCRCPSPPPPRRPRLTPGTEPRPTRNPGAINRPSGPFLRRPNHSRSEHAGATENSSPVVGYRGNRAGPSPRRWPAGAGRARPGGPPVASGGLGSTLRDRLLPEHPPEVDHRRDDARWQSARRSGSRRCSVSPRPVSSRSRSVR